MQRGLVLASARWAVNALRLLDPSSRCTWRIHDAAESALLVDGRDYYRAFFAAAMAAERSILLLGWQFDSDVELLRGPDLPPGRAPKDVELLTLLGRLCRERAGLEVRILAWDHSLVFAFERELLQRLYFEAWTCDRFVFRWDATVPMGGSHHQKVAIVDGRIAFFGSQDICQARWDDPSHAPENPQRRVRGAWQQPYHEVQVAVTGEPARSLVDLFVDRWLGATGERLAPSALVDSGSGPRPSLGLDAIPTSLRMPPARIGLARTIPVFPGRAPAREVASLLASAIARAERTLYLETQYLTSRAVRDALVARMADRQRPRLDVVVFLPERPERLKEELTIGAAQAEVLRSLDEAARVHGHAFAVYHVRAGERGAAGARSPVFVYIHSKLAIVDDRVFVVGSANLTNRSLTIDSEIVAAYEAGDGDDDAALRAAIAGVRARLVTEHCGQPVRGADGERGLVAALDAFVGERLCRYDPARLEPSLLARAVHELAHDVLDPWSEDESAA
jgi:phosphatidylserine/phosphatidylglycerophosphate/cardiolipin synthase-like enzyme